MKHRITLFSLLLLALLHVVPLRAQDDGIVTQLQFGRQTVTVPAEGELVFYDFKGPDRINSVSTNNQHSLTVFKPAVDGMSVQITFESIDIQNDGNAYPGKVLVYSGDPDSQDAFAWSTTTGGVTESSLMPEGDVLATLDGVYSGLTYYSAAADGSLGVGVLWRYAKACDGWVAKVKCVKLTDMQVTGASSNYENVISSPKSKAGVVLAHVAIDAEGVMNADKLTGVRFRLPLNEGVIDPVTVRLYAEGRDGVKGLTPLETTVSPDGEGYRLVLERQLGSGRNHFTLAADILGTAKVGAKVKVDIEGVTTSAHPAGVFPFDKAQAVEIVNPAIVCMVPGSQIIQVDATPLAFYDDGGVDEKVTSKFTGTTTFLPVVEGKKVQVEFSKVALANGSIYYQYLKVYNGTEAKPENLIMQVRHGQTALIHSTSPDGALTVELGDNGTTQTGDGFEGTVSLFDPAPMTLEGIAMTGVSEETMRAGATAQPMAMINMCTANTEPALALSRLKMASTGAQGIVAKAWLTTAATAPRVLANAVESNGYIAFELADPLILKEGDNMLTVLVDAEGSAVNDQEITLQLVSATLGGVEHEGAGETVTRKVYNKLVSDAGTQDVSIYGRWEVTNKPSDYSYYGYDDISDDQILIIRPGEEGAFVQLNFSKLEIKFPAYYGTSPVFKVFNGAGTGGSVLFEATKNNQSAQVGKDLRSTDPSGALTILFNTKGNRGTSTSNGFAAVALPYKIQPMAVKSVVASQAATRDIYADDREEEILKLTVTTEGGESPLSIDELTVDLKGCEEFVKNVKLISSGANSEYVQPVTLVASAPAAATVTLRPDEGAGVLAENDNYYWLAFDMADKLPDGREVDARIVSMKVNGKNVEVTNPDPEGVRTTRNIYKFHGDDVVLVDEPLLFYDNGGPSAYYTRDYAGAVVFKPADPAKSVRMHFNSFKTGYNDELYVYNGSGTAEADQLIKLYGDKAQPRDLASSTADGALTARFRTGSYGLTDEGWEILVETFTPEPLALESVSSVSAASAQVYGGSQRNGMVHVQVDVKGERGDFNLKEVNFDVSDTMHGAIAAAKVWSTGTEPTFLGAVQFGETAVPAEGASGLSFAGEYNFPHAGSYHFWLTYDVASGIEAGTTLKASLKSVTIEDETTECSSDAAVTTVRAGMHGDYVIGISGKADYKTFAAAIRDLSNNGVDGPVNMLIEDGAYEEAFTFNPVPGSSEVNRVTFCSESGNRDKVVISYGEADKPLGQGVVNFADGANHITLQGVTVTSPAKKCDGIVTLTGGCMYDTIDDCVIKGNTGLLYEDRVILVYTYYLEQPDKNCNYFTLSNSRLEGGYYGLSATGITNLNYPMMIHDVTVTGNTFVNQSGKALQAMGVNGGLVIRDNKFLNDGAVMMTGYRNMDLYRCTGEVVVADNLVDINVGKMYNSSDFVDSSDAEGIYIRDISSARPSQKRIYNNDIRMNGEDGTDHALYGIYVYDNDPSIQRTDIAYNTIVISGSAGKYSSPFMMSAGMSGSTMVNNVLQNNAGGPVLRGTAKGPLSEMTISDNALHTTGSVWAMTPSDCNSFEAAAEAIGQSLGMAEQADFLGPDMHELKSAGNLIAARPLDYVTTDRLGNPRHGGTPTIGAYEYTDQTGVPAWSEGYPEVNGVTVNSAMLNLCADKASMARCLVMKADAEAPDAGSFDDCAVISLHTNSVATANLDGLEEATAYKAYVKLVSYLGVETPQIAVVPFSTLSPVPVYPNPVAVITTRDVSEGDEGEQIVLSGEGSGGMEPLSFKWTDQTGKVLSTTSDVIIDLTHSMTYRFTVTDNRGKEAFEEINIDVRGNQYVATFEDLNLKPESFWGGNNTNEPFYSGSFAFDYYHDVNGGYEYWGHFSHANLTSTSYSDMSDQYNSAVGSGVEGSDTYGVAYVDSYLGATYLTVTNKTEGDRVAGMWLTNSAWVMDAIKNGDGLSTVPGGFAKDDYFKVSITGLLNARQTGTVDFYLADFRADDEIDRYALDSWQWVDLSPLGVVNKLWFKLESTKKNSWGMTTPQYFCLDNVGEGCPWRDVAEQVVDIVDGADGTLDLNALFGFDPSEGTVTYSVESTDDIATLDASANGFVKVDGTTGGYKEDPFMLLARGTQQGRSSYLRVPVRLNYTNSPAGLDRLAAEAVKVYPVPAHDVLNISTEIDGYDAELFDMQGVCVLSETGLGGLTQLELPDIAPGVYMLRISHASGTAVRRIVVK